MFEYVDTKFLVLDGVLIAILLFMAIFESGHNQSKGLNEIGARIFAAVSIVIILLLTLYSEVSSRDTVQENITLYKKGIALKCGVGFNSYLIESNRGWELRKRSFLKDDLLIPIRNCDRSAQGE